MIKPTREFAQLLRDCRVQAVYQDSSGRRRRAPLEALLELLRGLNVDICDPADAGKLLSARRDARLARGIEPVHVAWDGSLRPVEVYLRKAIAKESISYHIDIEPEALEGSYRIDQLESLPFEASSESRSIAKRLCLPGALPFGYHRLTVSAGGSSFRSLIISAPRRAFRHQSAGSAGRSKQTQREWGCFLPLYALRTEHDWGVGDFSALGDVASWAAWLGASDVGILPVFAAFLDEPFEISPYRPVTRLYWNELYLDIESVPELRESAEARALVDSTEFRRQLQLQRESQLVNYREVMALKRSVLERLAKEFFERRPPRFEEFESFRREHGDIDNYGAFRAACEQMRKPWREWPDRMRQGNWEAGDFDPSAKDYHLYVQWLAAGKLSQLHAKSESAGSGLYLDLPIGVDPAGYDVWRYQSRFIGGASAGAPPDAIFTKGQDWGLPPFDPDGIRQNGYDVLRRAMATSMKVARHLRIDHILGFHRIFCIPPGHAPEHGSFLNYEAEEMYAVAILESHLNECELIGENLGTVPRYVDRAMKSHGIAGMWVAPYELESGRRRQLSPPTSHQAAMLNTHDMPPLAAWWDGLEIADRVELNLIGVDDAGRERAEREQAKKIVREWLRTAVAEGNDLAEDADRAPLLPLLKALAAAPAPFLLVNLEDLWLETQPQNIPGVSQERPNWRHKSRFTFEEFSQLPFVLDILRQVNEARKSKEPVHEHRHVDAFTA